MWGVIWAVCKILGKWWRPHVLTCLQAPGQGKTSNDFWNFGVLRMLITFRVRAVESVHQAGKLWIQLTSRFDFTVPGTGEPTKYGGRDADPEKPIVMGKCRLGCGSTRGEPLECQRYVDLQMLGAPGTEWVWRRMISSVKVLHQFVVRPTHSRVFCLSLMLVCEYLGSCQNPQVFQSYKETTWHQVFLFWTQMLLQVFWYSKNAYNTLIQDQHLIVRRFDEWPRGNEHLYTI